MKTLVDKIRDMVREASARDIYQVVTDARVSHDSLTHKQPDSLERIEEDAMKCAIDYWGCNGAHCTVCPVKVDGKSPSERYGTCGCFDAQKFDLLRRQRELLERGQ